MKSISFQTLLPPALRTASPLAPEAAEGYESPDLLSAAARPSPAQAQGCPGPGRVVAESRARCAAGAGGGQAGGRGAAPPQVFRPTPPPPRAFPAAARPAAAPSVGRASAAASPRARTLRPGSPRRRGTRWDHGALPAARRGDLASPNPAGFRGAGRGRYLPSAAAERDAGG